jgi:hypothetical protein
MAMYYHYGSTYGPGLGGLNNGQYRNATSKASGGTINATNPAHMGALATIPNQSAKVYPPPVESAGIRTGEITAVRVWGLVGGFLTSVYMSNTWIPGDVMKAHTVSTWHGEGIHAFKDLDYAKQEYRYGGIIFGEVALWGDVIEYEYGYKAEFAKITKIYSEGGLFKRLAIRKLRKKYGV